VVSSSTPTLGTLIRAREAGAAASPGAGRRLLVVARPGRSGMLLAEGTQSQSFATLALILAVTSFIGSIGFIRFLAQLRSVEEDSS